MKKYNLIQNPNTYDVLVNKQNKLPDNYVPQDLTIINSCYSDKIQKVRNIVQINFEKMVKVAKNGNLIIKAVSTYRSYNYQKELFDYYVKEKGLEYAKMASAEAGFSEHQTGLAIDVADESLDYDNFGNTEEYNWLLKNSHKYGFIIRYPQNKTNITGYKYEPWHIRYVGEIAKYLYDNDLTLEEYFENANN